MKLRYLFIVMLTAVLAACSSYQGDIENVEFLLDQGKYGEAVTELEQLLSDNPNDANLKVLKAKANIGLGFLGTNAEGEANNFLTVLADFFDGKASGESDLQAMRSATPANIPSNSSELIAEALNLLEEVQEASLTQEDFLFLGFTRLADLVNLLVIKVNALANDPCDLTPANVTTEERSRIDRNLTNVTIDFGKGGLDLGGNALETQLNDIKQNLDTATSLADFLTSEYGPCV